MYVCVSVGVGRGGVRVGVGAVLVVETHFTIHGFENLCTGSGEEES
jgi:hypothetical protein